ncbi:hypothetical protein [Prosthecobacter sp.]|uniref:hypothetical protein n=1 Tax=Prosthecobacter sp. TaxID=1965333 RepID=UPI0037830330
MDKTEEIINLIWDKEVYYLVSAGKDAPAERELKEYASSIGIPLPQDYLYHATGYWGGLYLEVREEYWPRHKAFDVGPFWSFLYGLYVYAFSDEAPDWMQVKLATERFQEMGHQVMPILKVVGDADIYCFNQQGKIQRYSHEEDSFEDYEGGFFDLLRHEFLELEQRRKNKLAQLSENRR